MDHLHIYLHLRQTLESIGLVWIIVQLQSNLFYAHMINYEASNF